MLRLPEPFVRAEIAYRRERAVAGLSDARHEPRRLFFTLRHMGRRPSPTTPRTFGRLATTQHC